MEKLIKLLNKYEKKSEVHWYEWYGQDVLMCRYLIVKDGFEFYTDEATTIAISKYYGFIKWLVENGKIRREKIPAVIKVDGYLADGSDTEYYNMEESLLMQLSISNSPIEDLILYLK